MVDFPSLAGQGMISVDVETCDPELKTRGSGAHRGSYIAGVAVGTEAGFRNYYPVAHEPGGNLPKPQVMGWLREQMKIPVPKVGANLLYDIGFLAVEDIELTGPIYDIQVAEPLLNENRFVYNLESLSQEYLNEGKKDQELDDYLVRNFGKKNPKNNIWRAPPDVVAPYAIGDIDLPLRIFAEQTKKLNGEDLWDLFIMESKLIPLLAKMRQRGVRVDVSKAEQMRDECNDNRNQLVEDIRRQTDIAIAPSGMGKEIMAVLRAVGVTDFAKTPTGRDSLTAAFIESIDHPVAAMIVEVRKMDKLVGTFLEGSILEAHHNGRIHCNFNQLKGENGGAVSGRFSSSMPNLQFIPVRTELGKRIRSMFLPEEGQRWYKLDYSQIEYVLMIHDAVMLNLKGARDIAEKYRSDVDADFHQLVADMARIDRQRAKTINFGLAYGEGVDKLCKQLKLTREDGEDFIRQYHKNVPFMKPLIQGCMEMAAQTGEIRTLLKRKRRFDAWEIWDRKTKKSVILRHKVTGARRAFCHKALNARTQGSAADIMKAAMADLCGKEDVLRTLGVPQLTVHDELDGSMPDTPEGREAVTEMQRTMENCVKLSIPLRVDVEIGQDWGTTQ